jgi:hypothetical protein
VEPALLSGLEIRRYRSPQDAAATFALFQAAIRETASAVYEPGQVDAWAGPPRADLDGWDSRRREAATLVAASGGIVVGFTDLLADGLVDYFVGAGHAPTVRRRQRPVRRLRFWVPNVPAKTAW